MEKKHLPDWITDPDKEHINMHEPFERQYWLREWGINEEQLQAARLRAGCSIISAIYSQVRLINPGLEQSNEDTLEPSILSSMEGLNRMHAR